MFLKSLTLSNILSFGPEPHKVELGPLNIVIGPNGSGKSNFIEAIGLLKAAPNDIREPIRDSGGIDDWIWKGDKKNAKATINANFVSKILDCETSYEIEFFAYRSQLHIEQEKFSLTFPEPDGESDFLYDIKDENIRITDAKKGGEISGYDFKKTSLSQMSKLIRFAQGLAGPEVEAYLDRLSRIRIYADFSVHKESPARVPQKADLPNVYLSPDLTNFGLIINKIKRNVDARQNLREAIQDLYENIDDIDVQIEGGTVQVFVYEGRMAVPATRLSSGTLRFLCLLAILCHPEPPPLICLEEPELGLHPDLIPTVSRLLKEASERTQIIVTTHSDILIDTMTDRPETVLVAEKGEGGTRLTRLDPERLKPWLEKYRLGQLWTSGEIGGTRW